MTEMTEKPRKSQDPVPGERAPSVYDNSSFISQLYSLFAGPFLWRIHRQENVDLSIITKCAKDDRCDPLANHLEKNWEMELRRRKGGKKASLVRAIIKTFAFRFLIGCFPNFLVYGFFKLYAPVALGKIIYHAKRFAEEQIGKPGSFQVVSRNVSFNGVMEQFLNYPEGDPKTDVAIWSGVLALIIGLNFLVSHPYWMYRFKNGMNIRVAVSRLIYQKALKTPTYIVQKIGVGKIVNLVANDANRLQIVTLYCEFTFMAILDFIVAVLILYSYLGRSAFGLVAIILLYGPFQCAMARILSIFRGKSIALTDDRLRLMSEILPAMQVIKMYVWEVPFAGLVNVARKLEMAKIRLAMMLRAVNISLYFASPKVMGFFLLILYMADGGELDAEVVFVTLSIVFQVRDTVTYFLPQGISYSAEAYVSTKRIEAFLLEEDVVKMLPFNGQATEPTISLRNVTVESKDEEPILKDVSFRAKAGELTVIVGPVGSGKSSILLSIQKELPLKSGSIKTHGSVIYVSQEAWIFKGSVRRNILFGKNYDQKKFQEVVEAAALAKDLQGFKNGEMEEIDDRGTSLSGGQKARVSLARALYADADCYLLDDPLSAVDVSVAKHIFEKCIKTYLKNKCVILVTHQLQFIKSADQIVVVKDGGILAVGSYNALLAKGVDVFKYAKMDAASDVPRPRFLSRKESFATEIISRRNSIRSESFIGSEIDSNIEQFASLNDSSFVSPEEEQQYEQENEQHDYEGHYSAQKIGRLQLYWLYVRAGGGILLFSFFLFSNVMTQVLFTGSDYWLSIWTDHQEKISLHQNVSTPALLLPEDSGNKVIYSLLVGGLFIASVARTVSYYMMCTRASVTLHNNMFSSLIKAPLAFFQKTPIGVIMNRVSRDLGIIDDLIPPTAYEAVDILTNSAGIFIICAAVNQYVLIPFAFLIFVCYIANRFYVKNARKVKKLEAIARSPIFSQMSSTLAGLPTIRSYHAQQMMVKRFSMSQDLHTSTLYMFYSSSRLFGEVLDFLCLVYLYSLMFILNYFLEDYPASVIGLTISQSLMLTNAFNWGIRQYTEVETQMTSVERVIEFGRLEKEDLENRTVEPPKNWPQKGEIVYENVQLCYTQVNEDKVEQKVVLDDINLRIESGEKVGIVGETGAGKSSLIVTLFRLAKVSGRIAIDGVDTGEISLAKLRSTISIIPQEPILFSGSVRRNLDPFGTVNDDVLWQALAKVQLHEKVKSLPRGLDTVMSEFGDFSVGQKQLLCLARAIIRDNKILVLDEATANVDPQTDALIQETIRKEFAHCTVLTIAHRLNTIIDSDKILVLVSGRCGEFDSPHELLKKPEGHFKRMVSRLSPEEQQEFAKIAERADEKRRHRFNPSLKI